MYAAERTCSRLNRSLMRRGLVAFDASLVTVSAASFGPSFERRRRTDDRAWRGFAHPIAFSRATITVRPIAKPSTGELKSGTRTLNPKLPHWTAFAPAAAHAAPIRPPMRAWLLELGMASAHVIRFQVMAPIRAAINTVAPLFRIMLSWTMPLPIVPATAVPNTRAPTKLAVAERRIACSGFRARVDTDVAMALAVA